jgi:hypothetical protein
MHFKANRIFKPISGSFLYRILLFISFLAIQCKDPRLNFNEIVNQYLEIGKAIEANYPRISINAAPGLIKSFVSNIGDTSTTILRRSISKDSIEVKIGLCENALQKLLTSHRIEDTILLRLNWMLGNLKAAKFLMSVENGNKNTDFEFESLQLFNIQAPNFSEQTFKLINEKLDSLIPGNGPIKDRFRDLNNKFIIPKNKIDTVFKSIISESRRRTKLHLLLPSDESVQIQYTSKNPNRGFYQYLGNNKGCIWINVEYPVNVLNAIEIACHEGYAGHHVYNILMGRSQKNKDFKEFNFCLLRGPQGFINEAIPSFSREMVFASNEEKEFVKQVLLPLAGIDTTNFDLFFKCSSIRTNINYISNEISRRLMTGTLSDEEALKWLEDYAYLTKDECIYAIENIRNSRSLNTSYNFGRDLVQQFVTLNSFSDEYGSWGHAYSWLMSNIISPSDLDKKILLHGL